MYFESEIMKDVNDYLQPEEFDLFYKGLSNQRNKALFFMLYKTGRRVSEIVGDKETNSIGIRKVDINFIDKVINYIILKKKPILNKDLTKENRLLLRKEYEPTRKTLPVNSRVIEMLATICSARNIGLYNKPFDITRQRVHQIFKKTARDMGIERRVHCHMLRHSFAIEFLRRNKSALAIKLLQEHLGHSDIRMTMTYLKFIPESELRQAVE